MPRIRLATRRTNVRNVEGLERQGGLATQGAPKPAEGSAPAEAEQEGQDRSDDQQLPRRGSAELKAIIEALIFASPDPLTLKAIYKLLDNEPKEDVQAAVAELKQDYDRPGGLQLVEVAGG